MEGAKKLKVEEAVREREEEVEEEEKEDEKDKEEEEVEEVEEEEEEDWHNTLEDVLIVEQASNECWAQAWLLMHSTLSLLF
jgi:hypothetical protein